MLARRLKNLLSIRERAALVRFYFAGFHSQPNLQSHHATVINKNISLRKTLPSSSTSQRWLDGNVKNHRMVSMACPIPTDDSNISDEQITENASARSMLLKSQKNLKTFGRPLENFYNVSDEEAASILKKDWKDADSKALLEAFQKLSCHAKTAALILDEDHYKDILAALKAKLPEFSDEQIHQMFQCLCLWKNNKKNNYAPYTELYEEISEECLKRLKNWTLEEALVMCDYLYELHMVRKLQFPAIVMKKMGSKPNRLTPTLFLHFMFLLNVCRKPYINMYEIEYRFDKILEEFTADELGVIAMGFFKTETPFRDQKVLTRMQAKVIEEIDTIQEVSLSAIMKMTRYCTGLRDLKLLTEILEAVKPRVSELAIPCLVHIALAAAGVQLHNAELMQLMMNRFEKNIDQARLKDLERFAWTLSIFNYDSNLPIYQTIIDTLRDPKRAAELERFATVIPTLMVHLSFVGVFPLDFIKRSLDPEFLQRVYNANAYKIGWDFFALESNVISEVPEYDGPFLPKGVRSFLTKKYLSNVKAMKPNRTPPAERLILEVAHMCKLAVGSNEAIHIDHVLPHFMKPDIILCFDKQNNPVAPEPILSEIPLGTIKKPPPEAGDLKWIAIVLATQNQIIKGPDNQYIGPFVSKLKQLQKLGYHTIVVSHTDWTVLHTLEAKEKYLRNILHISTDNKLSANAV